MASTPITAQTAAVVSPLRDLTDGSVAKAASKSEFASNVSRFFKSRKLKVTKNPPPPPIRVSKVTTEDSAASEVTGQKSVSSTGNGPFYDDAWDIRLSRLGLQASQAQSIPPPPALPSLKQRQNSGGRGPPDGAAMCESSCSLTSTPSVALSPGFVDAPAPRTTISTFAPSVGQSSSPPHTDSKVAPTASEEAVPPSTESDPPEGVATPTPSSNLNWFPPPPPTPLHLSLHVDDPASSQPRRYHEHRRSFEMDDEQLLTGNDSGDAITLPPLSPSPPQENTCPSGDGRASVSSFLLNLPPPPTVTDLSAEESAHPPVIPPRDPKTSVTTPTEPPVTDLDSHLPTSQPAPLSKQRESSELLKSQQRQQRCGVDGRSVVPWERGAPPTSTAIDLSGSLPQWVPPQHSEASLLHRAPRSIGHRSTKSQSGSDGIGDDRVPRPLSLAASGRSQSQHRGRRHTTHAFGDETVVAGSTPTNGSSDRRAVRMDSDSSVMAAARTMMSAGDVWTTAVSRDGRLRAPCSLQWKGRN
uniref:SEC7 domain-containing protein n=1 Tax=Mesocestoides corti TaxID=53468 RepID=A0A5K3FMD7_MESCO